eukprot:CAMPEP_0197918736 /NCGR_PEP_ID=MMETSP1439-20131203/86009_1 /TAXON_ID=66791 /ORGANISM="Gonyaulax spinifera, Strain CCMP409" /LENGTH=63 /DNA_ID=CAMNT_0043540863 /DNA_START=177 /DNA_END=365 /DNA_ORIENTATION=+
MEKTSLDDAKGSLGWGVRPDSCLRQAASIDGAAEKGEPFPTAGKSRHAEDATSVEDEPSPQTR